MQKISDILIENIKNLPMWVKQVITKEIFDDLNKKLEEFNELAEINDLFQYMCPKVTFKGKQELQEKTLALSDGYYVFLKELIEGNNIFEITIKNNWTLADSAKIFCRLNELEYLLIPDYSTNKNVAIALFIAGKLKTGEFLKRIGKVSAIQLEQAIRYQKELNDEGRHIKMASILIKLGFITDKGLDSLLLLKDEAKKRLPINVGLVSAKLTTQEDEQDQVSRMQREIARLENENIIMKKRLKKLLNIND
ncbi:MAG: hypothetical protein IJB79_07660 [Candidatus Gastranaerophilales bacterium]|nr:hypothetical protein [Candidatus Gastranaerophilales bacterium]